MKVLQKFPATTAGNRDFVTGRTKPGRVVDLQVDVEALPHVGMLVVHEDTVKMMVAKLGWKLEDTDALNAAIAWADKLEIDLIEISDLVRKMQNVSVPEKVEA
jgi:hypothetical protein